MTDEALPSLRELMARVDHAVLKLGATLADVREGARLARARGVRALVVAPSHLEAAAAALAGSDVRLAAVVGFPAGASTVAAKQFEALEAYKHGAVELDVVINTGALRGGDAGYVERELADVMKVTPECWHKAIIETGLLTASEVVSAVRVVNRVGPRFIKTCTGVGPRGVTLADVELIRADLKRDILVKASGGVRDLDAVLALVRAGAAVIGTSSTEAIAGELEARRARAGA